MSEQDLFVLENLGYTAYCIADVMQDKYGCKLMNNGCDTVWAMAIDMANKFIRSEYNVPTRSEYECIQDYCNDNGDEWFNKISKN